MYQILEYQNVEQQNLEKQKLEFHKIGAPEIWNTRILGKRYNTTPTICSHFQPLSYFNLFKSLKMFIFVWPQKLEYKKLDYDNL